ncbi:MBL fold metallo-hydrolase [Parasediminibacterium sp. JCM 36343]|uniref:MBL fold metallo-hydrolase n=1 Tax=Parasediminibacterium sp. JCM 36343 TaxID=3374279 RepID=UPI00397D7E52
MKLYTINAGYFKLDGGAMFGVVPKSIWNKLNPADENNMCTWALRCLLIEDEGKLVLIDTGMGNKQDAKFFSHYHIPEEDDTLEGSLAILGFAPEDITDVILTHLHFDHCGGAIIEEDEKLMPAFPNATYWSNQHHWQWALYPNAREKASFLKENILPIASSGMLQMVEFEHGEMENSLLANVPSEISNNISFRITNGHTKAMMLPQILYKGRTIVYMADLLPSVAHIPLPYVMAYDMFPLLTLDEKKSFLQEALDNNYILYFEHDPENECCTLQQTEKGIRVKDIFKLGEI